jgi:DNA-binding CsgD family transcriptional regulator
MDGREAVTVVRRRGSRSALIGDVLAYAQECPEPETFRSWLLQYLERHLGYDSAIYVPVVPTAARATLLNKHGFEHCVQRYRQQPARYRGVLERGAAAASRERGVVLDTDIFSAHERQTLPFYRDIMQPQNITHQALVFLSLHGNRTATLFLCRHGRARRFPASVLGELRTLVPALALVHSAYAAGATAKADPLLAGLSPREHEIASLVGNGLRNQDIARLLGTSPHTVHNQLATIFRKLTLSGRAELAALYARTMQ